MSWLGRLGRSPSPDSTEPEKEATAWTERTTPGIAELFRGIEADGTHSLLDLGRAEPSTLEVYRPYVRWVRFADLQGDGADHSRIGWSEGLRGLPTAAEEPYDLVLAWDILDRTPPEERPRLTNRLREITAPDARMHLMVDASQRSAAPFLKFTLTDVDRMRYEPVGPPQATWPPLLPAEVERLVHPFRVVRAFTSKMGLREYLAVRGSP